VSFVQDGSSTTPAGAGASKTDTPDPVAIPNDGSIGSNFLHAALAGPALMSNWELVSAKHSTNGHAIAVMGPQVGYFKPPGSDGGGPSTGRGSTPAAHRSRG